MPIKFITLNDKFNRLLSHSTRSARFIQEEFWQAKIMVSEQSQNRYEVLNMRIENYVPIRKTYYVSPANSLCFMDGGIDRALSQDVFPNIEPIVKQAVRLYGAVNLIGRPYLPIGSSIIIDSPSDRLKSLVVSPTMLLPQNVSSTHNAYYATVAALYNILVNRGEKVDEVDIVLTSFCCGWGRMAEEESVSQMLQGIADYRQYRPPVVKGNVILCEPNLEEQPKYYQNTEWIVIEPKDIVYAQ
jgi:O-acetyl-ADP-ribose deacetylase (regulator of RNase III)